MRTLLFILLTTFCFGAEFLVKAKAHWKDSYTKEKVDSLSAEELEEYNARSEIGDVIVVRPDGWQWGKAEGLPDFVVIKIPEMTYEEAKKYEEKIYEYSDWETYKLKKMRKYKFKVQDIDDAKITDGVMVKTKADGIEDMEDKTK